MVDCGFPQNSLAHQPALGLSAAAGDRWASVCPGGPGSHQSPEGSCVPHHAIVSLHCQPVAVDVPVMLHLPSCRKSSLLLFFSFLGPPLLFLLLSPSSNQQLQGHFPTLVGSPPVEGLSCWEVQEDLNGMRCSPLEVEERGIWSSQ